MKVKLILVLLLGIFSMALNAKTVTQDQAQIYSNINSFAVMADQGAYEYLGRLMAPELIVDYSSLFGGEAQKVKREQLMKQWADFLPGFDTTFHDLSHVRLNIQGDKAVANVDFTASHWLGEQGFWQVSGEYEFSLQRSGDNWQITGVKVTGKGEQGSREVLADAPKHAQKNLAERSAQKVEY